MFANPQAVALMTLLPFPDSLNIDYAFFLSISLSFPKMIDLQLGSKSDLFPKIGRDRGRKE